MTAQFVFLMTYGDIEMEDREKYIIRIGEELIEVTPDVYHTYYQMARNERGQEEKKIRNGVVSFDALDNEEMVGSEGIPDLISPNPEDLAILREQSDQIHKAINMLMQSERKLIHALYYENMTEEAYGERIGMSQSGVSYRRRKILSKLKHYLELMESFDEYLL